MRIVVDADGALALADPDDLERFHIELAGPPPDAETLAAALATIGSPAGTGAKGEVEHWVDIAALTRISSRGDDAGWLAALQAMLDKVERFGWYDRAASRIKAHVVAG